MFPKICPDLPVSHRKQLKLLNEIRQIKGVKKAAIASGIRHDLVLADKTNGADYLKTIVKHHISGQIKVAPEHSQPHILEMMGKPDTASLLAFRKLFYETVRTFRKNTFLTYYLIAAHPGCTERDMVKLKRFAVEKLRLIPEQVQVFHPDPLYLFHPDVLYRHQPV